MNRTSSFAERLHDAVAGTALAESPPAAVSRFLEARSGDDAVRRLDGPVVAGLARALFSYAPVAGFLSHQPVLLERIASADSETLPARARELRADDTPPGDDLEAELDALRILRRRETLLTACLDLGGIASFHQVYDYLSVLAETITRRALALAHAHAGIADTPSFSVIGLGKIAGREFTYHSDLDLIFLCEAGPEAIAKASRIGQRLISYLSTMTGAGIAYAVDTRLRPSGRQGVLVTSFDSYERYQLEQAETWEHLALLRSRAIAGDTTEAQRRLDRARAPILARDSEPWAYIADLRQRVERERTRSREGTASLKTGPGGLMDVDFLATGGLVEVADRVLPALPSAPAMLLAAVQGRGVDRLVDDYQFVRRVESRARWMAGRGVEDAPVSGAAGETLAALVAPGTDAEALAQRLVETQARIRAAWDAVVQAGTIRALAS